MMTDPHFASAAKKPWARSARKWLQGQKIKGLVGWVIKLLGQQEYQMLVYGDTNCKKHINVCAGYVTPGFAWATRIAACDGQGWYRGRYLKVCSSSGVNWYSYLLFNELMPASTTWPWFIFYILNLMLYCLSTILKTLACFHLSSLTSVNF